MGAQNSPECYQTIERRCNKCRVICFFLMNMLESRQEMKQNPNDCIFYTENARIHKARILKTFLEIF